MPLHLLDQPLVTPTHKLAGRIRIQEIQKIIIHGREKLATGSFSDSTGAVATNSRHACIRF